MVWNSMLDSGVYCTVARLALDLGLDLDLVMIWGLHFERILWSALTCIGSALLLLAYTLLFSC